MTDSTPSGELPAGFSGIVRLFPLPNLVVFPHAVQALHVFEPRYREMVEDALAGDQLIAMALLQPGWEADYDGRPPVEPMTCIGRVLAHTRLDDGRYNLLLQGVSRAQLVREFPPEQPFRLGEVAVASDVYPAGGAAQRSLLQRALLRMFQKLVPDSPVAREQLEQFLSQQLPLGAIADILAFSVPFELDFKKQLLNECNVDRRVQQLLDRLNELDNEPADNPSPFPPDFSEN